MASQDPSTAYTVAPEKKSGSWFSSFSLPKLPNFFGPSTPAPATAAAPVPASRPTAPSAAIVEQSSVQPGGRRRHSRKGTKKAGRRHRRSRKGGLTPAEDIKWKDSDLRYMAEGTKAVFPPTQVRKPTGKGRRTYRVKKHSRR
jgi:hypothetical protein